MTLQSGVPLSLAVGSDGWADPAFTQSRVCTPLPTNRNRCRTPTGTRPNSVAHVPELLCPLWTGTAQPTTEPMWPPC